MSKLLSSLLPLHQIASTRGDGLRQDLLVLLEKNTYRGQNVQFLKVDVKSIGPRDQIFTDDDIANSNFLKFNKNSVINR